MDTNGYELMKGTAEWVKILSADNLIFKLNQLAICTLPFLHLLFLGLYAVSVGEGIGDIICLDRTLGCFAQTDEADRTHRGHIFSHVFELLDAVPSNAPWTLPRVI